MTGLPMNTGEAEAALAAVCAAPLEGDFVWDGADEDERPFSAAELRAGLEAYKRKSGAPLELSAANNPVAEARRKLRVSQADFARIVGATGQAISQWETGRNSIPGPLAALCKILLQRPDTLAVIAPAFIASPSGENSPSPQYHPKGFSPPAG